MERWRSKRLEIMLQVELRKCVPVLGGGKESFEARIGHRPQMQFAAATLFFERGVHEEIRYEACRDSIFLVWEINKCG